MNLENQLSLMEKYNLTAEEVMFIDLLFSASIEEGHPEFLYRYSVLPPSIRSNFINLLQSLKDKGIIVKSFKIPEEGTIFDPEKVEFNKNFLRNYRKYSGELGKEFLINYPSTCIINGYEVGLKNIAKKFNSVEDFFYAYGKAIGWKESEHNRVINLLRWAKDNQCRLLNMNIADFVISRMWNSIEELKNGEGVVNFDNLKVL